MKLTSSLIYEATLDDQLFAELPAMVAAAFEARSCVFHWRDQTGAAEISTHSGYFSDDQMADYATNFVEHDLWTSAGMAQGFVNKAWKTSDLVPNEHYESSIFYNEWIRSMGDDTYYCCGSVMRTAHGHGIIGLHRGRTGGDFSDRALRDLNRQVEHLRRMFAIRGRTANLASRNNLLQQLFATGPQAAILVGRGGRLWEVNHAADALLRTGRFLRSQGGHLRPASDRGQPEFKAALAAAFDHRATNCLLHARDGTMVMASMMPVLVALSDPLVLVTIDGPRGNLDPRLIIGHLQDRYRLSPAEADIAMRLANGSTIREIGDQRQSAAGTVRTQVKSILHKLDARRQGDVVRLVNRLSVSGSIDMSCEPDRL